MKIRLFLILCLFTTAFFISKAERYYYFDHVTTTDGLHSNTIYCTLQDRNGFMWIGSKDGLSRYDGNSFIKMRDLVKEDGIGGNVFAICEDIEGKIWFSTPDGIHIYNPLTGHLQAIDMVSGTSCFSIQADHKGKVWIITDKLYRFDCSTLEYESYSFEDNMAISVAIDTYDTTWIALTDGSILTYDVRTDSFLPRIFDQKIRNIVAAEDGKLLMTTAGNEVMYIDCVTLSYEVLYKAEKGNSVMCIVERTKDECWIGTQQGLFIRRAGTDYKGQAIHDEATPESISAD